MRPTLVNVVVLLASLSLGVAVVAAHTGSGLLDEIHYEISVCLLKGVGGGGK